MSHASRSELPPAGLGLSSVVLGAIALALFALPVLGLPLAAAGLVVGMAGTIAAFFFTAFDIRLALAGMAVCVLALSVDCAMFYAPSYTPSTQGTFPHMPLLPPVKPRVVPPPAPFR
jgi:hypothetical protein